MTLEPIVLFPLLVAAGVIAQLTGAKLRIPALLLLLGLGILLGPVLGIVNPEKLLGEKLLQAFVSLAVAIVLFEGGMSLNIKEARHVGRTLWALILAGLVLGFALVTTVGVVCGLSLATAATLGGILVVTGPTVILPMLRSARVSLRPAALLKWEGIVNDPFGALLAYFVLQVALVNPGPGATQGFAALVLGFLGFSALAGLVGGCSGYSLGRALSKGWIPEHLRSPLILAAALVVYAGCESFQHESGLLAVTMMGLVLGNLKDTPIEDIQHFKEQITTLLVALLFLVLSARLELESLNALIGAPLFIILAVVFVVRPLVVLTATFRSDLPWSERILVGWIAPRGVVAAAVAGAFSPDLVAAGYPDAQLLEPIVFGVIITTVVLHGLTISPLARKLGLATGEGNGILIVGASLWGNSMAQALTKAGGFVVLADTRYRKVSQARIEGLEVHHGDVRSEDLLMELPMERIRLVLAATEDDAYNSLVMADLQRDLGRQSVFSLTPQSASAADSRPHLTGNHPWGEGATYRSITRRFWIGQTFRVTTLTEEFNWEKLTTSNPDALFLFQIADNKLRAIPHDSDPKLKSGARIVYLGPTEASRPAGAPIATSTGPATA